MATNPANRIGQVFRLPPSVNKWERLTLCALADYGDRIFPSQRALAAKTQIPLSTLKRTLASLRRKQLVSSRGTGKALTYHLNLAHSGLGGWPAVSQVVARSGLGGSSPVARDPNTQTNTQTNPAAADAAAGGSFQGIDPETVERIRRWHPRLDVGELATAQRRALAGRLAKVGRRDVRAWWRVLVERWSRTGVPPYDQLAAELEALGPNVRDPGAVLAFRLGIGKVAA